MQPLKFKAHFDKFPEKYSTTEKQLLKSIILTDAELIGGGSQVINTVNWAHFYKFLLSWLSFVRMLDASPFLREIIM